MNTNSLDSNKTLTSLITSLTPLNNKFRTVDAPVEKIKLMWMFGKIIDDYLVNNNIKLHSLLYQIYDPHSTAKMSYITRDLGSYSYRIYKYFKSETDIQETLKGLKKYSIFREAIPLLFNDKYKLSIEDKNEILTLINSKLDPNSIISTIRKKKKEILPRKNPRNQKANLYNQNKENLHIYNHKLVDFYANHEALPDENTIALALGNKKDRECFISILMALAGDAFLNKLEKVDPTNLDDNWKGLYSIANSKNLNRARFRKWVINSAKLLKMAEAINNLSNDTFYKGFRTNFLKS